MQTDEIMMLAVRLLGVCTGLLLLPGVLLLAVLRVHATWHYRIVLGFALSYSWVFVLSVVIPAGGWTVDHAGALTLLLVGGLGIVIVRRAWPLRLTDARPPGDALLMGAIVAACALAGWIIEPPITGEEALDLASVSRFADGGPITFVNTSLLPNTPPPYLFQPYQLALGLISRWSGTDALVTFIKFRAFLAPLTVVFLYSLLRRLTATRTETNAAFGIVLIFIALDMTTAQWNSWFPFVRRGGFTASVCVPALMALSLAATRHAEGREGVLGRRLALAAAAFLLIASMATHPLEMLPLLGFVAALAVSVTTRLDPAGARKPALGLIVLLVAAAAAYVALLTSAVPAVAAYGAAEKQALWTQLGAMARDPITAIAGGTTTAHDLLTRTLPDTTATVFGVLALALVALRAPATAALLALSIVPLALMYASPAGFIALQLLAAESVVRDVNAYFGLLGLLSLAIGIAVLVQAGLQAAVWRQAGFRRVLVQSAIGSLVVWIVFEAGVAGVPWFAARTAVQPGLLLLVAVAVTVIVVTLAARRAPLLPPAPFSFAVVVLAACVGLPLAAPHWAFGGIFADREVVTLATEYRTARSSPSVLDWESYYETLRRSIAPPISVPGAVVGELRRRIPPRQVVLADPRYSCALVVLFDGYCINPEWIYNTLYFKTAEKYHADYVRIGSGGRAEHPFFNANTTPTDAERRLLTEYRVSYLLTDPETAEPTSAKLHALGATLEMEHGGYRLYRIAGS